MAVTFPNSPILNQSYQAENGLTYIWDGEKWSSQSAYNITEDNYIRKDGSNTAVFADATSVGIGTSNPSGKLHVAGDSIFIAGTGGGTLNIVSANNSANAGNKIAFFGANRFDTDEEMAYIQPLLTSNNGGSGNVQDGHLTFGTSGTERVRIDSSGNVGIGTSSPTGKLEIAGNSSNTEIKYGDGTPSGYFSSTTNVNRPSAQTAIHNHDFRWSGDLVSRISALTGDNTVNKDDGLLAFYTRTSGTVGSIPERMRIDSSGNVGIGTDNPNARLDVSATGTAQTAAFRTDQTQSRLRFINRKNDGSGTSNVYVGSHQEDFVVLTNATTKFRVLRDGGVTFDGTSAQANALDDYEVGTWTPEYGGSTSDPTVTYDQQTATYTKIGNVVTCSFELRTDSVSGGSGDLTIKGLPFNVANNQGYRGSLNVGLATNFAGETPISGLPTTNNSTVTLYASGATNTDDLLVNDIADLNTGTNSNTLYCSFTYFTST